MTKKTKVNKQTEGKRALAVFDALGFGQSDYNDAVTRRNTDALLEDMFARDMARKRAREAGKNILDKGPQATV